MQGLGRDLSLAVGGQSLAQMFRLFGKEAFNRRLAELAPEAGNVSIWGHTRGGTLAASSNVVSRRPERQSRFWWDMARDAPAPEFVAGLAKLDLPRPCDCLFWDQGQSEAAPLKGKNGRDPAAARADYRYATRRILEYWRVQLAPDDPARIPILLMPHAPHPGERGRAGAGVLVARAAQYELIQQLPNCHDAGIVRNMEMNDNMHPTRAGIQLYAACVAETFARIILPQVRQALPLPAACDA